MSSATYIGTYIPRMNCNRPAKRIFNHIPPPHFNIQISPNLLFNLPRVHFPFTHTKWCMYDRVCTFERTFYVCDWCFSISFSSLVLAQLFFTRLRCNGFNECFRVCVCVCVCCTGHVVLRRRSVCCILLLCIYCLYILYWLANHGKLY